MKKKKTGLIITFVALLFLLAGYMVLKSLNLEENRDKESENKTVFKVKRDEIQEVKVENKGNIYTFFCKENTWEYKEDNRLPMNQAEIEELVDEIAAVEASREIKNPEELTEYGLDKPEILVDVKMKSGETHILEFGNDNLTLGSCYMKNNGEKTVYLVDSSIKQKMNFDINSFIEKEEIPSVSATTIQKVEIKDKEKSKVLKKDDQSETGWTYQELVNGEEKNSFAADSSKVNSFMNNYTGLVWKEFITCEAENLAEYGLDNPDIITIDYRIEEEDKQNILYIGKQNSEGDYYAMLKDGKNIYTISSSAVKLMAEIEKESLVSSLIADYSFADLDKVTFIKDGESYVAEKKKTKEEESKYYLNGKEIDQNLFQEFYSTVSSMEWQTIANDVQLEKTPDMTIIFEKEGGIKVTVDYSLYDNSFYLVEDSKGNEWFVNKMKVKEMLDSFDKMLEEWKK